MTTPSHPIQPRDVRLEGAFVELTMAANRTQDPALCGVYITRLLTRRKYSLDEIEEGLASTFTISRLPRFLSTGSKELPMLRETRPLIQLVAIASDEYPDPKMITPTLQKAGKTWVAVVLCRVDIEMALSTFRTSAQTHEENIARLKDAIFVPHPARAQAVEETRRRIKREYETELARGLAQWVQTGHRTVAVTRVDMAFQTVAFLGDDELPGVQFLMTWLYHPYLPLWRVDQAVLYNAHPATPIGVTAIDMERLDYLAMGLAPQWMCGLAKVSGTRDGQSGVNHHSGSYEANVQHEMDPARRQEFIDRAMRATTLPLLMREILICQLELGEDVDGVVDTNTDMEPSTSAHLRRQTFAM